MAVEGLNNGNNVISGESAVRVFAPRRPESGGKPRAALERAPNES
jgi:hypothetical protein